MHQKNRQRLIANAARVDPTGTARLRKQFSVFYNQAWAAVASTAAAIAHQTSGLASAAEKIAFFDRRIDVMASDVLNRARYDQQFGLDAMARSAYRAGVVAADTDLEDTATSDAPPPALGDAGQAQDEPAHREWLLALLLLLGSKYDGMVTIGVVRLRERFAEDATNGASQAEIERNQRATGKEQGARGTRVLVDYAVVKAFNDAILNRFGQAGKTKVGVIAEMHFQTAGDVRVCQRCNGLASTDNGRGAGVYTLAQAQGIIPVHSLCRCRWTLA